METKEAIRSVASSAGLALTEVARNMGRNENFLYATLSRGSTPKADTLANIANACGYELALVPRRDLPDSAITIDAS